MKNYLWLLSRTCVDLRRDVRAGACEGVRVCWYERGGWQQGGEISGCFCRIFFF